MKKSKLMLIVVSSMMILFANVKSFAEQSFAVDFLVPFSELYPSFPLGSTPNPALALQKGMLFVAIGDIYPAGTIEQCDPSTASCPVAKIGRWVCHGAVYKDIPFAALSDPQSPLLHGPDLLGTQLFDFFVNGQEGVNMITSVGPEFPPSPLASAAHRAIAGGTGIYNDIRGTHTVSVINMFMGPTGPVIAARAVFTYQK